MHIRPASLGLTFHAVVALVVPWCAAAAECLGCLAPLEGHAWMAVQTDTSQGRVMMKAVTL